VKLPACYGVPIPASPWAVTAAGCGGFLAPLAADFERDSAPAHDESLGKRQIRPLTSRPVVALAAAGDNEVKPTAIPPE